jgi:hypothetical protein
MDHLATVFLQDTCAILLDEEDRHSSPFFQLPIFQNVVFLNAFACFERQSAHLKDPNTDPTIDVMKKASPIIGNHVAGIHVEQKSQGRVINEIREDLLKLKQEMKDEKQGVVQELRELLSDLQNGFRHEAFVRECTYEAHLQSPYRDHCVGVSSPLDHSHGAHSAHGAHVTPKDVSFIPGSTICTPNSSDTANCPTRNLHFPVSDSPDEDSFVIDQLIVAPEPKLVTAFSSLEEMYQTWNGAPGTLYETYGGLKTLWEDANYRKDKTESMKKAVRRLQYINKYFDYMVNVMGKTVEEVVQTIKTAFEKTNKKDYTLSGTELVLRKIMKWDGKAIRHE